MKKWQDWGNLALGLWVFISPWVLQKATATGTEVAGVATSGAVWNMYIVGIAVAALAVAALIAFQTWEEWTNLVLGAWLFISPWALGFSSLALLTWSAVIAGALVVVLAGMAIAPKQGSSQDSSQGPAKHA